MLAINNRPFSLNHIIGNKGIVSEFKTRSLTHDYPNVMLFVGASGTGKTTLANIVASLINDENPIKQDGFLDPNPESPASKSILTEKYNRDTSFYDASRMSKEDVLKLEELVSTQPMFDKYRVVIIDEAQELSKTSKGVVLKLLEKKRSNTYIILCTMNPDAFDSSIRGRGLLYTFKSPSSSDIAANLFDLATRTGHELPESFLETGIFTVAENCEGSVRMSVQMLERCLMGGFFTSEQIEAEFGVMSNAKLAEIVSSLIRGDAKQFEAIKKMDPKEFFYASYKFISEALVFLRTGYVEATWKEAQYKAFEKIVPQVENLFTLYADIEQKMGSFFKPSYFLARLTECYTKVKSEEQRVAVSAPEPTPVKSR